MFSVAFMQQVHATIRLLPDDLRAAIVLSAQLNNTTPEGDVAEIIREFAGKQLEDLRSRYPEDVLLDMLKVAAGLTSVPSLPTKQQDLRTLKEKYLEAMWDTGSNNMALQLAGVSISAPYVWAQSDPEFTVRWNDARSFCGMKPYRPRRS